MEKQNIVVLFGGNSVEKDISTITTIQTINALDKNKYNVIPIYLTNDYRLLENSDFDKIETFRHDVFGKDVYFINKGNKLYLQREGLIKKKREIDFVIPAVHGKNVEDGTIAGFLETLGVAYSSCPVLSASIFQNKHITKVLLNYYDINNIEYVHILESDWVLHANESLKSITSLGFPVIIKACSLGSSIGIFKVKNEEDLFWALNTAFKYDKEIIVEKCLTNYREYNQAILGDSCSAIEEIKGAKEFLTFANKYEGVDVSRVFPAEFENLDLKDEITKTTKKIAKSFSVRGVIRVDYLYDLDSKKLFVNEINSIPGSLAFYLFDELDFTTLLDKMIQEGIKSRYLEKLKIATFPTNVLKNINGLNK